MSPKPLAAGAASSPLSLIPWRVWRAVSFALLLVATLAVRLWLIRRFPEPDTDAPGHLGIARALLADPANVAIHWVYLLAYHFVLAGLLLAGMTADAIRVLNCALAVLVPLAVFGYAERTAEAEPGGPSRYAPWMAAVFCAISPLVNLLGTSAQQETLFTLLVLGTVWAIDARRYALAGATLAFASLVRYEAWGAVALLALLFVAGRTPPIATRLPRWIGGPKGVPLAVVAPPILAIGVWLFARRMTEGTWLGFLRELYRYTHAQRDTFHRSPLWFPVDQPLYVFGSIVGALAFVGVRRSWRPSHVVPVGIYLFLLGAYAFKGALGSARYYESLTPFVALAAAHGVCALGSRRRWVAPALFAAASWQLVSLSTQLCRWTWPSSGAGAAVAPAATPDHGAGVDRGAHPPPSSPPASRATRTSRR